VYAGTLKLSSVGQIQASSIHVPAVSVGGLLGGGLSRYASHSPNVSNTKPGLAATYAAYSCSHDDCLVSHTFAATLGSATRTPLILNEVQFDTWLEK
jgi:hypothetical protein